MFIFYTRTQFNIQMKNVIDTSLLEPTNNVKLYFSSTETCLERPLVSDAISAGFPSPALDFSEIAIDLNKHIIKRPTATFFGRVEGSSMKDIGISDGDLIVIDKSLKPKNGRVAVCYVDGAFTIKTIQFTNESCWLIPANEAYKAIEITAENDFVIWGIVTYVIKAF